MTSNIPNFNYENQFEAEETQENSRALMVLELDLPVPTKQLTALDIFGKEDGAKDLLDRLEEHIESFEYGDLSLTKNKAAVTALSGKVSTTRSAMEKALKKHGGVV